MAQKLANVEINNVLSLENACARNYLFMISYLIKLFVSFVYIALAKKQNAEFRVRQGGKIADPIMLEWYF